jgi:small-conductance mechanosensitive channel
MVIVPNSTIGKSQIVNFNYPDPGYRLQVEIGIRYNADINEARRIIKDAVITVDGVEHDKPVDVLFMEYGDAAIVFRVRWWIDSYVDFYQMMDGVNGAIFEATAAAGIDLNTIYDVNVKLDAPDVALLAPLPRTNAPSAVQPAADVDAGHF